jgi:hypothetical protein
VFHWPGNRTGTNDKQCAGRARPKTPVAWRPVLSSSYISCPSLFLVSAEDEMSGALPAVAREGCDKVAGAKGWIYR